MAVNLLDMLSSSMGSDVLAAASKYLGESETSTKSAMSSLLPALLTGMSNKSATPAGAADLYRLVTGPNVDTGLVGNLASFLGGGEKTNSLLSLGGSLASSLLGSGPVGGLASSLASLAGIKPSAATSLIALAVPYLFGFLKKFLLDNKTDANGLASLLGAQKQYIDRAGVDSGLLRALGLGAPAATAAAAAPRAAVPPPITREPERRSGFAKWLPWVIGAIAALLLWNFLSRPSAPPAPAPAAKAPATTAPAPAPAPAATATTDLPVAVFFEVGKFDILEDGKAKIKAAADAIKSGKVGKVELTGFTDKTGDVAANEELAKNRAKAVKDALVAEGVTEGIIVMQPPAYVTGTGSDNQARRVEIKAGS
jgi:outer membrane protein OmpA-like peptidoglycan-associated protein